MAADLSIIAKNISKSYRLYRSPGDRLREALHPFKKKFHKDFQAVHDVSLSIPKGQTWGIIGLNGSGKSTLLKIICGILQPSSGSIEVSGRISALLELGSGFNPEFTGRQNVFFAGALAGFNREEMRERFEDIVAFADIAEFLDQPVKNYSSGMRLRLAFSVAIHVSPEILIVDEALAVGDVKFQHKCMNKIRSFQGKSTILFVSHDLNAIVTLCDRVVWLHKGKIMDVGFPKEIIERYTQAIHEGEKTDPSPEEQEKVPDKKDNSEDSFGSGEIEILECRLRSIERGEVESVFGGEKVACDLTVTFSKSIKEPIVGILIKNRLGVEIAGFNNDMIKETLPATESGAALRFSFHFSWPHLTPGSYSISPAVGEKIDGQPVIQHWVHDGLIFQSLRSVSPLVGLLDLQNTSIEVGDISLSRPDSVGEIGQG